VDKKISTKEKERGVNGGSKFKGRKKRKKKMKKPYLEKRGLF
jgi:hypothetical protein